VDKDLPLKVTGIAKDPPSIRTCLRPGAPLSLYYNAPWFMFGSTTIILSYLLLDEHASKETKLKKASPRLWTSIWAKT